LGGLVDQFRGAYQQGLLAEPMDMASFEDFGRGLAYFPFDLAGGAVDLANMGLLGIDAADKMVGDYLPELSSEKPFAGADYLIDAYASIFPDFARKNTGAELAGRLSSAIINPTKIAKAIDDMSVNVSKMISASRDAKSLRAEAVAAETAGDAQKAQEAAALARVAETEAAPLTGILKRIEADGKTPQFTVKDDGTYLSVIPNDVKSGQAGDTVARARAQISGEAKAGAGEDRLTAAEIRYILNDPNLNEAYQIGDRISRAVNGVPYDLHLAMPETGGGARGSSIAKQAAIGRAFSLAAEGSPEYKSAVFSAYGEKYPSLMEAIGAKGYDDLLDKSYRQLAAETELQFNRLPIGTTYHRGDLDYVTSTGGTNSIGMLRDVIQNKNLNVFRGGDRHDFLNAVDPQTGLNTNEMFRAVHDYFGHGVRGNKFDAAGEEVAYGAHSQMFSPLARMAMASETRGQNSLVNYSPLNVDLEMKIADAQKGLLSARTDAEKADLTNVIMDLQSQRQYAPQKSVLLPPEMLETSYGGGMPSYMRPINQPPAGTTMDDVPLYHYSNEGGLLNVDPSFVGSRMGKDYGKQEAASIKYYDRPERSYFFAGDEPARLLDPAQNADFGYRGTGSGIYDVMADPAGLRSLADLRNRGVSDRNLFYKDLEQSIKDYGYSGYAAPLPPSGAPTAQMFYPTPVTPYRGILFND
jgi:hypothetical protein